MIKFKDRFKRSHIRYNNGFVQIHGKVPLSYRENGYGHRPYRRLFPSIFRMDGTLEFYNKNGKLNRIEYPALVSIDGKIEYRIDGNLVGKFESLML